jgi:hypothetical protein
LYFLDFGLGLFVALSILLIAVALLLAVNLVVVGLDISL